MFLFSSSVVFNLSFGLDFFIFYFFLQSLVINHLVHSVYIFAKAACHLTQFLYNDDPSIFVSLFIFFFYHGYLFSYKFELGENYF